MSSSISPISHVGCVNRIRAVESGFKFLRKNGQADSDVADVPELLPAAVESEFQEKYSGGDGAINRERQDPMPGIRIRAARFPNPPQAESAGYGPSPSRRSRWPAPDSLAPRRPRFRNDDVVVACPSQLLQLR